jgi:CheY-like chemotaxis protein
MPQGRGETILLVDDEILFTRAISTVLRVNGYRVLTASDGSEALALYGKQGKEIAVVLTELKMHVIAGLNFTLALKDLNPCAKIILSSGYPTQDFNAELRGHCVDLILRKPYGVQELLVAIHEAIHGERPPAGVAALDDGSKQGPPQRLTAQPNLSKTSAWLSSPATTC